MRRPEGLRLPARGAAVVMAAITLPVSVMMFAAQLGFVAPPFLRPLRELARPFRSINQYGLFAVMTTRRLEIEVEGSMDGREWRAYRFTYKPGPLERRPPWVAPLQPRLDWQMWFAALSRPEEEVWFDRFLSRLRERSPSVLALLDADPFPGQSPQYLRATLYHYRFTAPGHAAAARSWWVREPIGRYVGASRDPVTMPRTMRTSTPAAGS